MVVNPAPEKIAPADLRRLAETELAKLSWLNPAEFLFRGVYRSSYDAELKQNEDEFQKAKEDLRKSIQKIAGLKIPDRPLNAKGNDSPWTFYNWLHGVDRTERLAKICKVARQEFSDVDEINLRLDFAIKRLNKMRDQLRKSIERKYFMACGAVYYNWLSKCGLTWWR